MRNLRSVWLIISEQDQRWLTCGWSMEPMDASGNPPLVELTYATAHAHIFNCLNAARQQAQESLSIEGPLPTRAYWFSQVEALTNARVYRCELIQWEAADA